MTTVCYPGQHTFVGAGTSYSYPNGNSSVGLARLPSDPYYFANVEVVNAVVGSAWVLGYDSGGAFEVLASGSVSASNFTIPGVPAYGSPFLMELRLRKASSGTKYRPFKANGYHSAQGSSFYCSQAVDEVNA